MIEEITKKENWNAVLNEIGSYDFYHTFDYHLLSKHDDENFVLIVYRNQSALIAIPFVIRPIEDTSHYDITSVYGYAGPISKNIPEDFDNNLFASELNTYFKVNKIVSVFSRLNPFVNHQKEILQNIGDCIDMSSIVAIDLTKDLETQRKGYQRRIKSHINKARRLCYIKKAETKADIDTFIDIYYENMDRVDAEESYYFDRDYFYNFLKSENFETDLLLAIDKKTNMVIAGVMFVKTNEIVQYHLSSTKASFLDINPGKLLIDEMRIIATERGYEHLNLGGGLGSKEDSLLRFKMSFSKDLKTFSVWKHVVDVETYSSLSPNKISKPTDYFPAYRSN